MPSLQTDRLDLRRWRPTDRIPFAQMNADPRVMEHFPNPLTLAQTDDLIRRIDAHFARHNFGLWAAELRSTGAFIGYIGLNIPSFAPPFKPHANPCVEIGWRLVHAHWGRGLATEGATAVLHHAFSVLNLEELVSFTVPANQRSRRVMEKLGMHRDPASDFDHPLLPAAHPLRRHASVIPSAK
jgi:RimJ/RimL family protein N-acetyltransferase